MSNNDLTKPIEWPLKPVDRELQYAVEQFYYRESQLLDYQKYDEWLGLMTEDIRYWMPLRTNHTTRDKALEYIPPGAMPTSTKIMRAYGRALPEIR